MSITKIINKIPLLKDLLLWFKITKEKNHLNDQKNNLLRAAVLTNYISKLQKNLLKFNYAGGIMVFGNRSYAHLDGILLKLENSNRYLKNSVNQGKELWNFLLSENISIKTVVDLGAFQGEIALYFCSQAPQAQILAIEPSNENYKILTENIAVQQFSTKNIIPLKQAMSDKNGTAIISTGKNVKNSLVANIETGESVETVTLSTLIEGYKLKEVSFLKIDIESSEPLLYESIKQNIAIINSILIEARDLPDYRPLINLLFDNYKCFDESFNVVASKDKLFEYLIKNKIADYLFIKK